MTEIKFLDELEKSTCILCGGDLSKMEQPQNTVCDYCGKVGTVSYICENGHYICNSCLKVPVMDFIQRVCTEYSSNNPIELAIKIMNSPIVRMHGAEHHYLTPAVLLTVYSNVTNKFSNLEQTLQDLKVFIRNEAPQKCSFQAGTCGAAIGSKVFFMHYLNDVFSPEELEEYGEYVKNETIRQIDEYHLPRCCKRDTYTSLLVTANFLNEKLDLNIEISEPKCIFSLRNKSCGLSDCPYFNVGNFVG